MEGTTGAITPEDQREDLDRVYLYWTPHPAWAVRVEYHRQRFERKDPLGLDLPTQVETTSVPVFVSYFRGAGRAAGLFAQVGATFVQQDVDLAPTSTLGRITTRGFGASPIIATADSPLRSMSLPCSLLATTSPSNTVMKVDRSSSFSTLTTLTETSEP